MALQSPLGLGALGDEGDEYWPPDPEGGWWDEEGNWCDAWDCYDQGGGGGSGWDDPGYDPYNFTFDDGSSWSMDPNSGDTTYYDATDGSYYTEFADGGYQFDYADGSSYYEGADGSWTDSATGCYGYADGSGECDDGSTWGPNGEPTNVKAARANAKQKAAEAAGKSAGASSGGSGSSGGKGSGQDQASQAAAIAACAARGGRFNAQTGQCVTGASSATSGQTLDAYFKKNLGFGVLPVALGIAALFILPALIKKF